MGNKQALCLGKGVQNNQFKNSYSSSKSTSSSLKSSTASGEITKNSFRILKVIGRGSFGKVFLVQKKGTRKLYAMKVLKKENILLRNQIDHTRSEREILQKAKHNPFLVQMHYAFQTQYKLYMVMDFMNGGELFYHLRREQRFSERRIKFYAAEIILAIESLHQSGIIYRDLKPENILLDNKGHIRITDFGLSKQGIFKQNEDMTFTVCGTPEYLAPEIIRGEGHGKAVDWWSLGALLYEMYCGRPPFQNTNKIQLLHTIATKKIDFSRIGRASEEFQNLIKRLLHHNPNRRLGGGDQDSEELRNHPFFSGLDWEQVRNKQIEPPFSPNVEDETDVSNIDISFLNEMPIDSPNEYKLTSSQKAKVHFDKFTYQRDDDILLNITTQEC
ncbi:protein kinase 2 [Stylonychia lemnae]|uniref:Protein kinase 2 n=1 Tax=Stylonychia lemnae TaxID=5949 RepID=A0A078B938_STYLE|nr:protein kinase 2 [Stylonychia lemnae]|eukprot:CDW90889.1 protein kinase 2 [Stylonychia lemnae]